MSTATTHGRAGCQWFTTAIKEELATTAASYCSPGSGLSTRLSLPRGSHPIQLNRWVPGGRVDRQPGDWKKKQTTPARTHTRIPHTTYTSTRKDTPAHTQTHPKAHTSALTRGEGREGGTDGGLRGRQDCGQPKRLALLQEVGSLWGCGI